MDSPTPEPRLSYADLERLDPNQRWELIDGVAYAMSSPRLAHQEVLGELYLRLKQYFRGSGCRVVMAPFDVKLSDFDIVQPDLLVSCEPKWGQRYHRGAPDLVVEILSPTSLRHDRIRKQALYHRAGVREYWIVNPYPLMIEVFSHEGAGYLNRGAYGQDGLLVSHLFPDLRLNLNEVAADLTPPEDADQLQEATPVYAVS